MTQSAQLRMYLLILKRIDSVSPSYPTLAQIKNYLEEYGMSVPSERTLRRHFQELRDDLGVSIRHSRLHGGYCLSFEEGEDASDFKQFLQLLEIASRVQHLTRSLSGHMRASRHIVLESNDAFQGAEYVAGLVQAIEQQVQVKFWYASYERPEPRLYQVEPQLVVENRNRWYLLAWVPTERKVKTFGVDRMQEIQRLAEPIGITPLDYRQMFRHTFGITVYDTKPEWVLLRFVPKQGQYIKTLPLHPTQKILSETEQGLEIAITVVPNLELTMQLLSYGHRVEVLAPATLRNEVKEELKKSLAYYSE